MSDAALRELARAAAGGDPLARARLRAARERLGLFVCGHVRPLGSSGSCWACRKPEEVLVGSVVIALDSRGFTAGRTHIVQKRSVFDDQGRVLEEDTFARCSGRLRGPGPIHWGVPTCRSCLSITKHLDRTTIARRQLRVFGDTSHLS